MSLLNSAHLLGLPKRPLRKARSAAQLEVSSTKPSPERFEHLVGLQPTRPIDNSAAIAAGWAKAFSMVAAQENKSVAGSWAAAFRKAGAKQ